MVTPCAVAVFKACVYTKVGVSKAKPTITYACISVSTFPTIARLTGLYRLLMDVLFFVPWVKIEKSVLLQLLNTLSSRCFSRYNTLGLCCVVSRLPRERTPCNIYACIVSHMFPTFEKTHPTRKNPPGFFT